MVLKKAIKKMTQNFKVRCKFCNESIKRKDAYFEHVKLLESVYPKNTSFCNKTCCSKYKEYELNAPRQISMCSSCPTPIEVIKSRMSTRG